MKSPPGTRRLLCWGGRAVAAEKVVGAPPVAGASRAPQGHLLENLGEVAGLQRASGGTRSAKWAKKWLAWDTEGQRDLAKTSRKR